MKKGNAEKKKHGEEGGKKEAQWHQRSPMSSKLPWYWGAQKKYLMLAFSVRPIFTSVQEPKFQKKEIIQIYTLFTQYLHNTHSAEEDLVPWSGGDFLWGQRKMWMSKSERLCTRRDSYQSISDSSFEVCTCAQNPHGIHRARYSSCLAKPKPVYSKNKTKDMSL